MKKEMKSLSVTLMARIFYLGIFVLLVIGGIAGYQTYKANEKQAQLKVLAIDAAKKYVEGNSIVVTKPMNTSLTYLKKEGYLGEFDHACIQNSYVAINSNSDYNPVITCGSKNDNHDITTYGIYEGILTYGVSVTPDYSNQEVTVTITTSEPVNSVYGWDLSADGTVLTKKYTENSDIALTLVAVSNAKKTADVAFRVNNIDRIAPILTVSYSDTTLTNQDVIVTIRGNEKLRAMEGWTLSSDSYSVSKAYSMNTNEMVSAMDLAGNTTEAQVVITNIDKEAPILTITRTPEEATKGTVVVTITANEEMQAVSGWELSSDKRSLSKSYTENTTETIIVRDIARNEISQEIKVDNIDKVAPTGTVHYSHTNVTKDSVTVTITASEAILPVEGWTLSSDQLSMTKVYTSNETETVTFMDIVGNIGTVEIEITNIDTTAPVVTTSYDVTTPTNGQVTVAITANEEMQPVEGWTLSSDKLSMTKEYSENTSEEVTVMDIAGNTSVVNITIINIDKIAPVVKIIYTPKELTNGNVVATVVANEPLQEVSGWTLSSDKLSMSKTYTENQTDNVTIIDEAGNQVKKHVYIANIDRKAPMVTVTYSNKEQTKDVVTITLTANKQLREFAGWTLSDDKLTLTKVVSENEKGTVDVTDLAGNITKVNYKVSNIDHVGPKTTVEYDKTELTNGSVVATIRANEAMLEVNGWTLSSDKLSMTKTYTENALENIIVSDLVGNTTTTTIKITNIDKEAPTIKIYYSPSELTNQDVVVTVVSNETLQEVTGWVLSNDKLSMTKTYTENKTETIGFTDLAGNRRNKSINVTNIDKEAPRLQLTYSTKDMTKDDVVVTVTSNEALQEVTGWVLSNDKLSMTKTYTENTKEEVTFLDLVGNASVATVKIKNIDKIAPTLTVSYDEKEATNGNVVVTITASEKVQAIEGWTLSEDGLSLTKTYKQNVKESLMVSDLVGNTSTANIKIKNIDKIAPTLAVSYDKTEATNGNVVVTITASEKVQAVEGWVLSNDKLSMTKTYEQNVEETVTVSDLVGNTSEATVHITNIDKTPAVVTVSYNPERKTNGNVIVTLTSDKPLQSLEGWIRSGDKLSMVKTYTENTEETVVVKDHVGNETTVQIKVTQIDRIAPTLTVTYSTTEPTKDAVTATIRANEKMQALEGWTLSRDKRSMSKEYSENTSEEVIVKDIAGNESIATVEINNIDKIAPIVTVSYNPKTWTNKDVTVTITANEKLKAVEGWTLSSNQLSMTKVYTENVKEVVTVSDLVGNVVDANVTIDYIDRVAPTVTVTYSPEENTKGDVTATITSNKKLRAVEGWTLTSDKRSMTKVYHENTEETVTVKDIAGNTSDAEIKITNIDHTAPVVEVTYSTTEPTKDTVTATIHANEKMQALEGWTLANDGMSMTKVYRDNVEEIVTVKDVAGNETQAMIKITNIDKEAPTLTVSYNPTTATKDDVIATITSNEKLQALDGWTLSQNGKSLSKVYSKNTKEVVEVKDIAGNISEATIKIRNIDKVAPVVKVDYSTTDGTKDPVIVTITANEPIREIDGWTRSEDKLSMTKTYRENTKEVVTVTDGVGNTTDVTVNVSNIDYTAPKLEVSYNPTTPTNKSVTATITASEKVQAVEGWTLSSDQLSMTKKFTSNTEQDVTVLDLAGNPSEITVKITNIDKVGPKTTVTYSTTELTNQNVIATITADEPLQELVGWTLSENKLSMSKAYESNMTEQVLVKDLAGNITATEVSIQNIDKTAPTVSATYSTKDWTKENVKVTLTSNKKMQELDGWDLDETGFVMTKVYENNHKETIAVMDIAGNKVNVTVKITNIDKEAPILKVVDGVNAYTADFTKEIHVSKTEIFKNLEAIATDNIDTKVKVTVTGTVDQSKLGSYPVTYEAVDHVGNKTIVVATIKVIDTEAPVITINGEASVTIGLGSKYIDAGATASDNYDTNVNLITTDNIDIFQVGTYYVTYTATDSSNNETVMKRTVIVEPGSASDLVRNVNECEETGDCYNKDNQDNYVWYSGYLWRIIKVNGNNTVKMVTEDSIAGFSYDNDSSVFDGSIAKDWLLNEFYPSLNNASSLVVASTYCNEPLLNTTQVRYNCNNANIVSSKVGLLTIDEYNILGADSSYLNTGDHFFTMTPSREGYMWVVQYDGTKKYTFHVNNPYAMRPVVILNTSAKIRTGRGTKHNPYRLEGDYSATQNTALNTRKTGEYVRFANQNWRIVSTGSLTKLVLDSNYVENGTSAKVVFGDHVSFNLTSGIGKYLNTNVYNNLFNDSEKQLLAPMNYYYNSYRLGDNPRTTSLTSAGTMVNAYVGLNNVGELMSGSSNTSRTPNFTSWLLNYNSVNNNGWFTSDGGTSEYSLLSNVRGIRPTVSLKSTVRIIDGNGTSTNPYVLAYQ